MKSRRFTVAIVTPVFRVVNRTVDQSRMVELTRPLIGASHPATGRTRRELAQRALSEETDSDWHARCRLRDALSGNVVEDD